MTQEEKELVLKDITARLSYGLKVQIDFGEHCIKYGIDRYVDDTVICVWPETFDVGVNDEDQSCDIEDVKPYLRPLSSMTEGEKKVFDKFVCIDEFAWNGDTEKGYLNQAIIMSDGIDWLNAHHFDYRGLIEKGLALEAPEGMYNIKN